MPDYQKAEADQISVGDRCQTIISNKRGTVKYVGKISELANGYWVGVHMDDPVGDCDGTL